MGVMWSIGLLFGVILAAADVALAFLAANKPGEEPLMTCIFVTYVLTLAGGESEWDKVTVGSKTTISECTRL